MDPFVMVLIVIMATAAYFYLGMLVKLSLWALFSGIQLTVWFLLRWALFVAITSGGLYLAAINYKLLGAFLALTGLGLGAAWNRHLDKAENCCCAGHNVRSWIRKLDKV